MRRVNICQYLWVFLLFLVVPHCGSNTKPAEKDSSTVLDKHTETPGESPRDSDTAKKRLFFWRAQKPQPTEKTVFLLGSIHLGNSNMFPLDPAIEAAYSASDALVVEVDTTAIAPAEMQKLIVSKAQLPPGTSLKQQLSAKTWNDLTASLTGLGMGMTSEVLSQFQPWYAAITISTLQVMKAGLRPELGIDHYFLHHPEKKEKPTLELETAAEQLDIFSEMPLKLQELMLRDAIEGVLQPLPSSMLLQKMIDAWSSGDTSKFEALLRSGIDEHPEFLPLFTQLIDERNIRMVERIELALKKRDNLFVVVGAGHLVGANGMVELFARKGYSIVQLARR